MKYKSLSLKEKQEILKAVSDGEEPKKDIAARYGIPRTTLSTILKKKHEIMGSSFSNARKRMKSSEYPKLEQCLLTWFTQCREKNLPVSGSMMKEKALYFARKMEIGDKFHASDGWLSNFKKRNNVVFKKMHGESASVDENICSDWKEKLNELLAKYESKDVFNADETGLYFKCLPDRTMCFKNETCHGGKHSKERVTFLLAVNMDGSQKLKLLMIGKSLKPRCFKNIKSFPMHYRANKKAWMTSALFSEWLAIVNEDMKKENRHILLFIDNCSAHNDIPFLTNIQVQFLPANTTSKLQPLDQGIIKVFKGLYRTEIVRLFLNCMEDEVECKTTVLTAMNFAHKAWLSIGSSTIQNCFKTCGFKKGDCTERLLEEVCVIDPPQWYRIPQNGNVRVTFHEYVHFDDALPVVGSFTDNEIVASCSTDTAPLGSDSEDECDEVSPQQSGISGKAAQNALAGVRDFLQRTDIDDTVFFALVTLEHAVDKARINTAVQKKLTDFFS